MESYTYGADDARVTRTRAGVTFPHSLLRPTVDGAVRTQHLRDPDAAAAAIAEVYLAIVALYGPAPLLRMGGVWRRSPP